MNRPTIFAFVLATLGAACGGGTNDPDMNLDMGVDMDVDLGNDMGPPGECDARPNGARCVDECTGGPTALCLCIAGDCVASDCGDGIPALAEACDDGNVVDTDACTNDCEVAECGDSIVRAGVEQCDDGNMVDADACSNACRSTTGTCGSSTTEGSEACDDGNVEPGDACKNDCTAAACGDGVLATATVAPEQCDDGNTTAGDGCSATCAFEACESCQVGSCSRFEPFGGANLFAECFLQDGEATDGPGADLRKSDLCANLLDCIVSSGCAANGVAVTECLCGPGVDPNPTGACATPTGPCAAMFQAAAESTSTSTVLERLVSPSFAVGNAARLVQCTQFVCEDACF